MHVSSHVKAITSVRPREGCATCDKLPRCHTCHIQMWMFPHTDKHIHHMCQKYEVNNLLGGHPGHSRQYDDFDKDDYNAGAIDGDNGDNWRWWWWQMQSCNDGDIVDCPNQYFFFGFVSSNFWLMVTETLMTILSRWAPQWLGRRATRATQATLTTPSLGPLDASLGGETSMDGKQVIFMESSQRCIIL